MIQPQSEQELFDQLLFYTLAHGDPAFIHQHVVDACAAQGADKNTKTIKAAFGLIGLYLHIEKGYTGKEVHRAHMQMARRRKTWPAFDLPTRRGRRDGRRRNGGGRRQAAGRGDRAVDALRVGRVEREPRKGGRGASIRTGKNDNKSS